MTGGLNELAAALGIDPLVPITPPTPRFSTIVRTQGRRPDSLAEALTTLAAQSYAHHETLLIVHHPDPTIAPAVEAGLPDEARPPNLRIVPVHEGDRSRPLNVGLAEATGDYVCILDDDDYVTHDWLAAFAEAAATAPGTMVRAIALSEPWTSDGAYQPVRATGPRERIFADRFDLLAHLSHNETPACSVALPLQAMRAFGIEVAEDLPVYEDWDLFMRVAQLCGVTSIDAETSIYRRLDHGNADTEVERQIWEQTHAKVISRLNTRPVIVPLGDAHRVASAHFVPGAGSRWQYDYERSTGELDAVTRSPLRFGRIFVGRLVGAVRARLSGPRG